MATAALTVQGHFAEREASRLKYYTMTQVGGLMILMSSIHPFHAANHLPALFILTACVIYERRKDASLRTRRILVWGSLAAALWIGLNALNKWVLPPPLGDTSLTLVPTFISAEQTVTFGYIGHIIVMVGLIHAFRDIRLSRKDPARAEATASA